MKKLDEQLTIFDDVFGILSPSQAKDLLNTIQENHLDSSRFISPISELLFEDWA